MIKPNTIIDLVRLRAECGPANRAYTFLSDGEEEEGSITYSELEYRSRAVAAWLQTKVQAGDRVLLLLPPGLEYLTAFFGCLFAGVIAVPAYPPKRRSSRSDGRIEAIVRDSVPSLILTSSSARIKHDPNDPPNRFCGIPWAEEESIPSELAEEWSAPLVTAASLAFIQYTSGSTSLPKGVMVSHENLLHNQLMIQEACQHDSRSTFVSWLPLYHDMGLVGNVLQPLFIGAPCILMSPAVFVQKPVRWLRAITKYRAHTSGGPNFAYDLCVCKIPHHEREGLDLSSWTVAFNGAEPVRQETIDQFSWEFGNYGFNPATLSPCYGLAEASLIVSCKPRLEMPTSICLDPRMVEKRHLQTVASPDDLKQTVVSCGPPVINTEIVIVDPDTCMPCPPASIGEVWISGPSVAQGYWNRPQESEDTFRARLAVEDPRRFLRTGDLGFIDDGELYIIGRLKDLIIIRGLNHCAEDLEWSAQQCSLRIGSTAAFSIEAEGEEKLVLVLEAQSASPDEDDHLVASIRQALSELHEVQAHAIVFVRPGCLPRTSSGKIQRGLCRKLFLQGDLKPVLHSPQQAPIAYIGQHLAETGRTL